MNLPTLSGSKLTAAFLLLLLSVFLPVSPATAQPVAPAERPEEPLVEEIEIQFEGVRTISEEAVRAQIQIREGQRLDPSLVNRSIRALYNTGFFEANIRTETTPLPDNRVRLTFIVPPKFRIGEIRIEGNDAVSTSRLLDEIESRPNDVLDERAIKDDTDALFEYYQKKGYSQVSVVPDIDRDETTGYARVTFEVDEGKRLKISRIEFTGNAAFSDKRLRKEMETKRRNWLSWLTGTGRFNEDTFQQDLDTIRDFYKNHGYLDVQLTEADVDLTTEGDSLIITINVTEGRQYETGVTTMEGNELFATEELLEQTELRPGAVFSPARLDEDITAIQDYYGQVGYLDTRVRAERRPNIDTGDIDVHYTVEEGQETFVETIQIEGNTKTKSIVILREMALAPGDIFNSVKMKTSEARLRNTRFFEQVSLTPEPTDLPGRKVLKVKVEEGRTGNLTFGAGFSSLDNALVFIELTQGNFDLFNYKSFFQGDGQKFRLRLQVGTASNEIVLFFEEPWLFEKRIAGGFELYRRETDYVSSEYDELRTGIELFLRKRLIGLWEGRLAYTLEHVEIFDVETEAPYVVREEEGSRTVSKIGFTLSHDTRDAFVFTHSGHRVAFITEYAGLGGNTDYIRLEARGTQFIPTFETGEQTIQLLGRIGTLLETGGNQVPFFDRYYLGGPYNLRGFDYREVGPKDDEATIGPGGAVLALPTFEPVGGNTYGMVSVEYLYRVAQPLRLAVFYDAGFVNREEFDFSVSEYNDNFGFGVRLLIMGAPLRLDYGIPITTDEYNDDGGQFHFSFGTRF